MNTNHHDLRPSHIQSNRGAGNLPVFGNSYGIVFDSQTKIRYYDGMKSAFLIICLAVSMFAGGCAEIQGKSIKTYHSEYRAAVQASSDALKNLEIPILEEVSDELKTHFLARRPNGIPVTVEVTRVDQNFTQVVVRTGAGIDPYFNREVSMQIHGFIRGRLSQTSRVKEE